MRRLVLFAVLLLGLPLLAAAEPPPVDAVPSHYTLWLDPDIGAGTLTGRESIEVALAKATTVIRLNAVGLELRNATVTSGATRSVATVRIENAAETATLTLPQAIPPGPARIELEFSGKLTEGLRGLYLAKTATRRYAVTQFEATYARLAFPCFDEPAYKATFDLTVVADKGDTAISNGKIVADQPGPRDGKHTIRFATSPRMSTYLVALAIGDFQCVEGESDGTPMRVCAVPGKQELGRFALHSAESFLKFYNRYYGIPYPFGKLDMVAVPDYEWGGMENTGAIFYRERALLLSPKTASVGGRRGVASVVAHEMAHQWFGDLVTMHWWDNVWLNEGFATLMAHKPLRDWDPSWDQDLDAAQATSVVLAADGQLSTRPIRQDGRTPGEIKELFDGIAYQKGAAVLRMVEAYVGEETFRTGVAAYLKKYANGNATAEDLAAELARASGKPVDKVLASFVDQPGVPLVSIATRCAAGHTEVTLEQQRFFQDPKQAAGAPKQLWTVPVCLRPAAPSGQPGQQAAVRCELLTEAKKTVTLDGCAPWVLLDPGATGYYRSAYTPEALARVTAAAPSLSPAEQISLLTDQWALTRAGRIGIARYMDLTASLSGSRVRAVAENLVNSLQGIGDTLVPADERPAYDAWLRQVIAPLSRDLGRGGETPETVETDDRKALRAVVFQAMGEAEDPPTIAEARQLVDRALASPTAVDPSLAAAAFTLAASHGDGALYDRLLAAQKTARTPEEAFRYLISLTAFRGDAQTDRSLALIASRDVRDQDLPAFLSGLLTNPASRLKAWAFLKEHWRDLQTRVVSFGGGGAVAAIGSFCEPGIESDVQRFFKENSAPGAERTVQRSEESIRSCIELKSLQGKELKEWLAAKMPAKDKAAR